PPSSYVPGISAAVDDLLLHMTEPAPEDRPADATEVLILVQHLLEHPQAAERLADERGQNQDATEIFEADATRIHDPDATHPFGAYEYVPLGSSATNPPPPPNEPNCTVLPPSVSAEATPLYYHSPVQQLPSVTPEPRDFGMKKPHDPVREFA